MSEMTKARVKYSKESMIVVKNYVMGLMSKDSDKTMSNVYALKLLTLIHVHGSPSFLGQIAKGIVSHQWQLRNGNIDLQNPSEKLMVIILISCLFLLSQSEENLQHRISIVEKAREVFAPMQVMQLVLLSQSSLAKLKGAVQRFATLSPSTSETVSAQLNSIVTQMEGDLAAIFNSQEPIMDKGLLPTVKEMFRIEAIVQRLRQQFQVRGNGVNGGTASEVKQKV